jgi:hypothetical protein
MTAMTALRAKMQNGPAKRSPSDARFLLAGGFFISIIDEVPGPGPPAQHGSLQTAHAALEAPRLVRETERPVESDIDHPVFG